MSAFNPKRTCRITGGAVAILKLTFWLEHMVEAHHRLAGDELAAART
jgi:hypothetical protein